ncbi:hypothetical protein ACLBWS_05255 [Brucellaceae bacterium D45D]
MADLRLRINELPEELSPAPIDNIAIDGPSTRRTSLQLAANAVRPYSTEAMAREGLNNASVMTPLRVSQAVETLGGQRFATAQQGNNADTAVQPTLTITAGTGLAGGGTLAANRTIALSSTSIASLALADSAVQPARQVIAGAGLTGGGSLAADRTFALDTPTIASLGRADSAVQPDRSISPGAGLIGGGNLSADRTIALNAASIASLAKADRAIQPERAINAGAGLTGGGDLSADRTLSLSTATQASLAKADSAIQAAGGTAGQILAKSSSAPGDVGWVDVEAATAVSYGPQSLTEGQKQQARENIDAFKASDVTDEALEMLKSSTPVITSLGYTPVNKAGDTMSGPIITTQVGILAPGPEIYALSSIGTIVIGTNSPFIAFNFSGLMIATNVNVGGTVGYVCGGGNVALAFQAGEHATEALYAPDQNGYAFFNRGGPARFSVMLLRTRDGA